MQYCTPNFLSFILFAIPGYKYIGTVEFLQLVLVNGKSWASNSKAQPYREVQLWSGLEC